MQLLTSTGDTLVLLQRGILIKKPIELNEVMDKLVDAGTLVEHLIK